jgi:putative transposase
VAEKCRCIEPDHPRVSVKRQCELIGVPPASYYPDAANGEAMAENLKLMRLIDEEYSRHPFYGRLKDPRPAETPGLQSNRRRVPRLMRKMDVVSIAPKPNTSRPTVDKCQNTLHFRVFPSPMLFLSL